MRRVSRSLNACFMLDGAYPYARGRLPGPGSQTLVFLGNAQSVYNPIGGGWQNNGANGGQIGTRGAMNLPRLIGVVWPGGYLTGQIFNPPLLKGGNQ